jgi:Fe-S oxidoreductase
VGVDVARFKSEFLADYWARHGTAWHARALGNARSMAALGSRWARTANWLLGTAPTRALNEAILGIDRRRRLPQFAGTPLTKRAGGRTGRDAMLFVDTFTNFYDPEIGVAALEVIEAAGVGVSLAGNGCCGRPQISKGLLADARELARRNAYALYQDAVAGRPLVFCEPSCLSAVREDAPALLSGEARERALGVAKASVLFEEYADSLGARLTLQAGPSRVLLHGHCHQKSMGLVTPARSLLSKIPGATVVDPDAGCCGMAGSFGYDKGHYDVSRAIGERKLFPAVRGREPGTAVVAAGTSCRHQIADFTGVTAEHPAVLLRSLVVGR